MITALPSQLSDVFSRKTSVAAVGVRSSLADATWVRNCGIGSGGFQPGNTCAAGGGGDKHLDTAALIESLPLDDFGKRRGVITNHGPLETAAYRVGKVDPKAKSGSVFFGLVKEDVAPYQGLHEGESIKEYKISLKKPVIAGHQNDLTRAWFNKPYGEMMDSFQRKYGKQGASVGTAAFDKKIMTEAVKRGFDGIVYLAPAPPAKTEIAVPTSGLKSSVAESTKGGPEPVKSLADALLKNCGIAAGGFQPGNQCAAGGTGSSSGGSSDDIEDLPAGLEAVGDKKSSSPGEPKHVKNLLKPPGEMLVHISELKKSRKLGLPPKVPVEVGRKSVEMYTGDEHYKTVNKKLREGAPIDSVPPELVPKLQMLAKQKLSTPVTSFRGVGKELFDSVYAKMKPGDVVEAKGFVSTSLDPKVALAFKSDGNGAILRIKAKTGIYVDDLSKMEKERELIQAHGVRYKHVETNTTTVGSKTVTVVTLQEI